jgi:hypothetical protein
MRRSPVLLLAAPLAAVLLVTGCSGGGADSDTSASPESASAQDGGSGGGSGGGSAEGPQPAAPQDAGSQPGAPAQEVSGRVVAPGAALVRTAELTVRVDDVRAAADEAARLALAATGAVASEERSGSGEDASAVVRLRVPPAQFDDTVARLADLGDELDRRVGTTDVTDQVVDLESRLATQRASVARVRALLDGAERLADVVQIEGELTRRTADLESLQARLAAVRGQVEQSTITLSLVGERAAGAAATGPRGFSDGLAAGWDALVAVTRAVGVTAGALLPFSPVLLVVAALLWRSRRRTPGPAGA